jgi:predicted Zn-dependent peptidase
MYNDRPQSVVFEAFLDLMYGDQPIGRTTIGTPGSVKSFTKKDLEKYHQLQYVPARTIISIAGNIDEKKIDELVKKYFKTSGTENGREKPKPKKVKSKNTTHVFKKIDQTHIIMGYPGVSVFSKDSHVYDLFARVLTGGMSSRLFTLLREELGVAYYVNSYSYNSLDHGTFLIASGITTEKSAFVIQKIQEVIFDIAQNGVSDEELKRTKNSLIGNMYLGLETSDAMSVYFGEQELVRGQIETPGEYEKKISKVTGSEIQAVAKVFAKKGLVKLASIGPQKDGKQFDAVLK